MAEVTAERVVKAEFSVMWRGGGGGGGGLMYYFYRSYITHIITVEIATVYTPI